MLCMIDKDKFKSNYQSAERSINILLTLDKEFKSIQLINRMDCTICLGELSNPQTLPCCSKSFCGDCLSNWVSIRSCCPLCIAPLGQPRNQIVLKSEEFDNGSLMLETQLAQAVERFTHLRALTHAKRMASRNHKNMFPTYRLELAEHTLQRIDVQAAFAALALSDNDRVNATNSIQAITELIYEVEAVLDGNSEVEFGYSSEEYEQEEDYEEDKHYEMAGQRKGNLKGSKRRI